MTWCWPAVVSVSRVASMSPMTAPCHESDARSPPLGLRRSTAILVARVEALMRRLMVSATCACSLRRRLTSDALHDAPTARPDTQFLNRGRKLAAVPDLAGL